MISFPHYLLNQPIKNWLKPWRFFFLQKAQLATFPFPCTPKSYKIHTKGSILYTVKTTDVFYLDENPTFLNMLTLYKNSVRFQVAWFVSVISWLSWKISLISRHIVYSLKSTYPLLMKFFVSFYFFKVCISISLGLKRNKEYWS